MCAIKIWCRKCIVCQRVDEIEYSNHQDGCGSCAVVRTTLPDQSLQGANENYRCRGCRSRQAYESHQLNNQIMEAREDNKYGYSRYYQRVYPLGDLTFGSFNLPTYTPTCAKRSSSTEPAGTAMTASPSNALVLAHQAVALDDELLRNGHLWSFHG
ncbi:hypothetical protein DER46DRAFT_642472 [Fusarium sp. MPI-SDFR-AT-0072]|nr:hypothetical protein DER46DRAFT_642472 [Fusarium sp. MPI-SDFR-AT-0072]